jgi:hypothetical protein
MVARRRRSGVVFQSHLRLNMHLVIGRALASRLCCLHFLRLLTLTLSASFLLAPRAGAQVPYGIVVTKAGVHEQSSASKVDQLYVGFLASVYLHTPIAPTVTVKLQLPNGTTRDLEVTGDDSFSTSAYYQNEAQLAAAYPDGTYKIIVSDGSSSNTTGFELAASVIAPTRITNFDALQAAGVSPQVTWQAIPGHGNAEFLYLSLYSSGSVRLSEETLTSAAVTSSSFANLLAGETYSGRLTYFGVNHTTANGGQTDIEAGGGFVVAFPVLRGTTPASAPTAPQATGGFASGANEITLSWQPPASGNPPTGYRVERASNDSFTSGLVTLNFDDASTTFVDGNVSPNTAYFYRVSATNPLGMSAPSSLVQVLTPATSGAGATKFVNIATRAYCSTGNSVTIGGFVVSGSAKKQVLIRAVGPSLTAQGLTSSEVLLDPTIEVHKGAPIIASNDNWGDNPNAAQITALAAQIGASPLLASDTKSSVLLLTLDPGVYSFVVTGKSGTSGVVLLEVYDADVTPTPSTFVNIATRANSASGNGVTIGGFVVAGGANKRVLIRAVGPTLTSQGLSSTEVLANPTIELHRGAPIIASNDNWISNYNANAISDTAARIGASPFAATDQSSAALLLNLPPGVYSFVVRGKSDTNGVTLVEVYDAD